MEKHFRVLIEKNRLSAKIELIEKSEGDLLLTYEELIHFLNKEKIVFGIKEDAVREISIRPLSISYPIIIAEGIPPKEGMDAYLLDEVQSEKCEKREKFNFRNVINIPSVKAGQTLATVIPPTPGSTGTDVTGRIIPAKNGKPLIIRPGKNVILNGSKFYSTSDGQISVTNKMISVNPVFEVNGDLDLKTGNIDFIGNVVIKGNVPSGYEVKAGGDVKIFGLVEAATIFAEGNIVISGGVSGSHKGCLIANGNIQAAYLNQANVQAEQDVFVENSILHSDVQAGGSLFCRKALVIGGILSVGKDLHVKEVGNKLFTKTEVRAGADYKLAEKENDLVKEKNELNENLKKLVNIEQKLLQIGKVKGFLSEEQKAIIFKQRVTKEHIVQQLKDLDEEIDRLEIEMNEKYDSSVYIYENIFPNTTLHFGKYAIQIQKKYSNCRYYFSNGEIVSESCISNSLLLQST
ncbi:DUF342 domain-containing protein [Cytobacillus massiliigabonensis]|uniref:DUF342 domain-containing protein n=1 Tax=Cytobacillus massiliigabonensis TaxID=1871011 RepID=UPI000C824004|nr:FapA family protein [Cytobacillus massiliigabonensis]